MKQEKRGRMEMVAYGGLLRCILLPVYVLSNQISVQSIHLSLSELSALHPSYNQIEFQTMRNKSDAKMS